MSTSLYRKYRPQTFAEVIGQKHIVTTLTNALTLGRVGHAYLLTGPRGTGKTTLARLFAKAINCTDRKKNSAEPCNHCQHCLLMAEGRSLDIIEIDAASHTGVDNIRELRETVNLPPTLGSHKIYIIDEVHMLSIGAWNALLKTLEEPPAHVIFIFATTALHKVPDTIVSRCQRFDLGRFPAKLIVEKLAMIAKEEKMKINKGALEMIALTAEGGMRDAESLLTQIASLEISLITEDTIIEILGTTKKENIVTLLRFIALGELYPSLSFVRTLVEDGVDLPVFCNVLLHYLRDLLLVSADPKNGPDELHSFTDEQKTALSQLAELSTPIEVIRMLEYFQTAQIASKTSTIPELPLQIAIVKILSENQEKITESREQGTENRERGTENKEQGIENHRPKTERTAPPTNQVQGSRVKDQDGKNLSVVQETSENTGAQAITLSLAMVREHWQAILKTAKQLNASLTLALSTARPIETQGATVVIAVKYPFHKERLDEKANQLTLSTAFDTILQTKIKLSIVLDTASSVSLEKAKETTAVDEAALNPLVTQAMDLLGGHVVTTENSW